MRDRLRQPGQALYKYRLFVPRFLSGKVSLDCEYLECDFDRRRCAGGTEYFFRIKRERDWVSRHVVKEEFKG
jgi:hypothetical protein